MSSKLQAFGWHPFFANCFAPFADEGLDPGRVVLQRRGRLRLQSAHDEVEAHLGGRFRHGSQGAQELPAVGDWVAFQRQSAGGPAIVHGVLPRRSTLSRKVAGTRAVEQVVAANVDVVVLVMGLDADFNLRRLERLLVMAWESGARPLVVLNKADLCPDPESRRSATAEVAPGVPVVVVSAWEGMLTELEARLELGETAALVGSSGVGKSTIINRLAGRDLFRTGAVRARDGRGQHVTTHRELVRLPSGSLLVDNPGVRELQLWSDGEGLQETFADVLELASSCRFRDCSHRDEPGCAVLAAVGAGELSQHRLANLRELEKEAESLERRRDVRARRQADKQLGKLYRSIQAAKGNRQRR
jgi:ribosome biogenesis GTPase